MGTAQRGWGEGEGTQLRPCSGLTKSFVWALSALPGPLSHSMNTSLPHANIENQHRWIPQVSASTPRAFAATPAAKRLEPPTSAECPPIGLILFEKKLILWWL